MIKLIQNELLKILKKKSIYILFVILAIVIIIYNYINVDQNFDVIKLDTLDMPVKLFEDNLEKIEGNSENYIEQKTSLDFAKLYNRYNENSWQRYALNEEKSSHSVEDFPTDLHHDITLILSSINDYEFNPHSKIAMQDYEIAKNKFLEYLEVLDKNDWKQFVNLKIKNLKERKKQSSISTDESRSLDIEIEIYQYRVDYNIEFTYDTLNQYIENLRSSQYLLESFLKTERFSSFYYKFIEEETAKIALYKYAIENRIVSDISNEVNVISDNQIDARIAFIRTFDHFDILIIIIAIYMSCTIIMEEKNRGTIKSLLLKPHKRSNILISKIFACIITILITILYIILVQYIVGGITFGFDSYNLDYIGYDYHHHQVFTMNLFCYLLLVGLAKLPMYVFIITFCILMGIINNNTAMTMILTLIIFILSGTIISEWSKYDGITFISSFFITNNLDFSKYLFGKTSDITGLTPLFSSFIYLAYEISIWGISIHKFIKKDIYNI